MTFESTQRNDVTQKKSAFNVTAFSKISYLVRIFVVQDQG
jgi:hypothetical protein